MAFFTYFATPGQARRGSPGPSAVSADGGEHQAMLEAAGFSDIVEIDLTGEFLTTAKAWYDGRRRHAAELARAEGEAPFSGKQSIYLDHVKSVQAGARSRCLFLARRS